MDRKTSKEKSVKRDNAKKKRDTAGSVKPGKPPARKYDFVVWPSVSGLTDKIILPGLPAVCDGLFHSWIGRSDTAFRLRHKGTAKKEIL